MGATAQGGIMSGEHVIHIITATRGNDGKLITFDMSYDDEAAANKIIAQLEDAIPNNKLIRVVDDRRLEQTVWLAAGQIIEVRRRFKHAADR
jgi:hypothetical protein